MNSKTVLCFVSVMSVWALTACSGESRSDFTEVSASYTALDPVAESDGTQLPLVVFGVKNAVVTLE